MDLEHEKRLADVENRAKSNTRRIEKVEEFKEVVNNLATAIQVMAVKQDGMVEKQDGLVEEVGRLNTTVEEIKEKPAKRAESIAEKIILVIVSALVGAALAHFGL